MIKLREMMDRNEKQITLLWVPGHMDIPGNEQADEEAKAALDDDIQQNEESSPKRSQKMVKNRNDRDQKRAIEKRKQQHERNKDKIRI
jgi:ribonuclease HI